MALNDPNPYQIPQADVTSLPLEGWHEPRSVRFSAGADWITTAWRLFKSAPGIWILITLITVACLMVASLIPFGSNLIVPLFMAGIYGAAQRAYVGEAITVNDLFAGFRRQALQLLLLGVASTLIAFLLLAGMLGIFFYLSALSTGATEGGAFLPQILFGLVLITAAFALTMATLYAPQLIYFEKMPILQAFKYSFLACWRNIASLTMFGILTILMFILTLITLGLGLLVVIPLLWIALYVSYYDIFVDNRP
ncbi:Hypothetical protein HDN1F_29220 [gamma proteobacterium HdN1]|nr:Hypothetical protein HDN1F_29220 [gamma proteobacterium HdN1]